MNRTAVLGNGVVITGASPQVIHDGAVAWQGERITAVGTTEETRRAFPQAAFLDAHGGLILPGFINLHHHFYSALARGLDPGVPLRDFGEVLSGLWWRLDRALDADTVRLSALLSAAECVRWGCTTVFDHHASPSHLRGSLELIAGAIDAAGLSAVLCYEVSDRNGHAEALEGIEENLELDAAHRDDPRVRGLMGLHASFTLREETLAEVADRCPPGAGCHVHVAEDPLDVRASVAAFGLGPVERLERHGLLGPRSLLAHGLHLGDGDYATIADTASVLIHNPESNANNGVGRLDLLRAADLGCTVTLGTDGMSSAMHRSLRAAFLAHRAAAADPAGGFAVMPRLLANNASVAARFFDEPLLGQLVAGAPADIAVVDAPPPTPITRDNAFGHLVYGASEAPVRHTIARGRVLLEDFRHTTLDVEALAAEARRLAPAMWERFRTLPAGGWRADHPAAKG